MLRDAFSGHLALVKALKRHQRLLARSRACFANEHVAPRQ